MEKLPLDLKASTGGLGKSRPRKRCLDSQEGKEVKCRKITRNQGRKHGPLEKWLLREEKGSGGPPRTLEP